MCGIAGIWHNGIDERHGTRGLVERMLQSMAHRGPDHEGIWSDDNAGVVLGQRRLSIIDLSASANQPMTFPGDDPITITFNGEIYNYKELREELLGHGFEFRTSSDTEVLLAGYKKWGTDVLDHLVGMFAFAIWDSRRQAMFLARDRAGEKPLYYGQVGGTLAFASEIQALARVPLVDKRIDVVAVALYLRYQYVPCPWSIYRGVRKLPPAHAMLVTRHSASIWRYWDPVEVQRSGCLKIGERDAEAELDHLLRKAVRGQMLADVPLGAFLSGGIDSSLVVSYMREVQATKVKTFTIGFRVPGFDESQHAQAVADWLGTEHHVDYLGESDALQLVPKIPQIYGEPFADSSALPTHLVACTARKHVTVSLSGDGGDEAFGGYTRYAWIRKLSRARRLIGPLAPIASPMLALLGSRASRASGLLRHRPESLYDRLISVFSPEEVRKLTGLAPEYPEPVRCWQGCRIPDVRRKAMLVDLNTYLPEAILVKVDRAAMATSLETRAPMLDHRVLEFALRLPTPAVTGKRILKKLARQRVPWRLLDRPKQGFGVPLAHWFRHELKDLLFDALSLERMEQVGIRDGRYIQCLRDEHMKGRGDHSARLWSALVLSLWVDGAR